MLAFYRERFSNAADFTFFMVGAFKVDEALPLLAQYVGALPSTGERRRAVQGRRHPLSRQTAQRDKVENGREPRSRRVISFFADPSLDPIEQENVIAATTVLESRCATSCARISGQTYTVSVGLSQALPQRGDGHIAGAASARRPRTSRR